MLNATFSDFQTPWIWAYIKLYCCQRPSFSFWRFRDRLKVPFPNNIYIGYIRIQCSTIVSNIGYSDLVAGLHAIELANNPWSCDCRLRPLKHWLVSNNVPHSQDPKCHSPPRLAGKLFANLQVDEFACPPELLSAPRYVEANAGKAFLAWKLYTFCIKA